MGLLSQNSYVSVAVLCVRGVGGHRAGEAVSMPMAWLQNQVWLFKEYSRYAHVSYRHVALCSFSFRLILLFTL